MKKIYCIVAQVALLLWFFLDMTGLHFGDKCLVARLMCYNKVVTPTPKVL